MPTHTTLSGHIITFDDPAPNVAVFLAELGRMLADASVTEDAMIARVYSKDNPILSPSLFADRGAVTRETFANPIYHVMGDYLARKRVAQDNISVDELAASYTLTVPEAAEHLGIHESAVRQAIAAHRLPSWVKEGRHYLSPRSVESFQIGTRGPQPDDPKRRAARVKGKPLEVKIGNAAGQSFRVKYPGELRDQAKAGAHVVTGFVPDGWKKLAVLSGGEGAHRLFVLEPDVEEREVKLGPFFVRGPFRIAKKINNADQARKAWKEIVAA